MAAVAMPLRREEPVMDTRTPSPTPRTGSTDSAADAYKPDLSAEVAMLSTKLVNAINYQTNLDDSLQQTRHEMESARKELARVRAQQKETDDMIANGVLVKKAHVDSTIAKLREELAAERAAREAAEMAKKETEGELEGLTTALFEEANTMVAAARKDTEAVEKRSSQLRAQLSDTELLLASQTEQLQDLKGVMERMEERASEHDPRDSSVPSTPINSNAAGGAWDALQQLSPNGVNGAPAAEVPSPDHPLHFSQLLVPVMRNDIAAYTDFSELLSLARRSAGGAPHSRQASGSAHNLASTSSQPNLQHAAASQSTIPGAFSFTTSSSTNNSPSTPTFTPHPQTSPPLKDSRFYKRTLLEDIEPTLRLDLAPGLSFLSRRSVLSSLLSGTLSIEPFTPSLKIYGPIFACALCGEARKNEPYVRKYRFRTSEEESAQRYPLCDYCLTRVRAAGDFVGFLRMVKDGHWRAESEGEVRGAWEEAVRLRERMFWARLGGGVVPVVVPAGLRREANGGSGSEAGVKSGRGSLESTPERAAGENAQAAARNAVREHEASSGLEPGEQQQQRPLSTSETGTGPADFGASTNTANTALPEDPPVSSEDGPADPAPAEHAHAHAHTETLHPDESEEGDEQATTPFEDAQSDTLEQQQVAASSAQLVRGADAAQLSVPSVNEPGKSVDGASESGAALPSASTASAASASTLHERRPSAVLARVRAMEAKAQGPAAPAAEKKFPGAFD